VPRAFCDVGGGGALQPSHQPTFIQCAPGPLEAPLDLSDKGGSRSPPRTTEEPLQQRLASLREALDEAEAGVDAKMRLRSRQDAHAAQQLLRVQQAPPEVRLLPSALPPLTLSATQEANAVCATDGSGPPLQPHRLPPLSTAQMHPSPLAPNATPQALGRKSLPPISPFALNNRARIQVSDGEGISVSLAQPQWDWSEVGTLRRQYPKHYTV